MSKLTTIRKVANGSLQGELVDNVQRPGVINALALLNKGDERFNKGNERRAWFPITLASLQEIGATPSQLEAIENLSQGEKVELNINSPKIGGYELRVEIKESIVADLYQHQNVTKTAKQLMITPEVAKSRIATAFDLMSHVGKNGYFLDEGGNFIFSRSSVNLEGQVNHTFIKGTLVPETELASYGAVLAEQASTVEQEA